MNDDAPTPTPSRHLLAYVEGWLLLLLPVFALLAGGAMLHVASSFGYTALGEPAIPAVHDR